jgi:pimeloyl-ACP methyl ester carboxylesterase
MPEIQVESSLLMHYEDHYFGEPWLEPETVVMLHGAAESSLAWYAWVPHLARRFRVIRPDLRGCGRSSGAPKEFDWSLGSLSADLDNFIAAMGLGAVHIVAAKLGAAVSLHFAGTYPHRVLSLSAVGAPVEKKARRSGNDGSPAAERPGGLRQWAAESQRSRLGPKVPEAQMEWWSDFMGSADPAGFAGLGKIMGSLENFWDLKKIAAPTLVISTEGSALGSVEAVKEWSSEIPRSELVILPGESYHIAAVEPDRCAELVLDFISRHRSAAKVRLG